MQVKRQFVEVTSRHLTIELPASFVNHKVEIIALTVDEEAPKPRRPHPDIAGKVQRCPAKARAWTHSSRHVRPLHPQGQDQGRVRRRQ